MLNIAIALTIGIYVVCLVLLKPGSGGGQLALKLIVINALGWLVILVLPDGGHPPLWLLVLLLFFPLNLVLLPAASAALWKSYKEREEKNSYLMMSGAYVFANFLVLVVIPITWLVTSM